MKKWIISLSALLACASGWADIPEPYASIRLVPYEPYFLPNSFLVSNEFAARSGAIFIDVRSEKGAAARYMAQNGGDSIKVYSVDEWDGWGEYQKFLSNVVQENNSDKVISFRLCSDEGAFAINAVADLIYLNTDDADTLADDICLWISHLQLTGAICGDNWNVPAIEYAVVKSGFELGYTVSVSGTFWVLHR
jgi:hypothetical protein